MTLFCPKCNATLPLVQEGEAQVCPICGYQVPIDYEARREEELQRRMQAELVKLQQHDLKIGSLLRNKIQPRLLKVADKFQFHLGVQCFPLPTREQVIELTGLLFPNNAQAVTEQLDQYGVAPRVQLAILKLTNGDLSKVPQILSTAKEDFREVVSLAESPSFFSTYFDNWSQLSESRQTEIAEQDLTQYLTWLDSLLSPGN